MLLLQVLSAGGQNEGDKILKKSGCRNILVKN